MERKKHVLHQAKVKNKCPECYSGEGLEFTFSQEELSNRFYSKASNDIEEKLFCHSCEQQIYPVSWDVDIERVYEYQKKQVVSKSTSPKIKPLAFIIALVALLAIAAGVYYSITAAQ